MLLNSSWRRMASCTTLGDGQTPPLFKLTMLRSTVNACWISRQKSSSRAACSGVRPSMEDAAARARLMESALSAASPVAARRNVRRCMTTPCPLPCGHGADQRATLRCRAPAPALDVPRHLGALQQELFVLALIRLLMRVGGEIVEFIRPVSVVAQHQFEAAVARHLRVAVMAKHHGTPVRFLGQGLAFKEQRITAAAEIAGGRLDLQQFAYGGHEIVNAHRFV